MKYDYIVSENSSPVSVVNIEEQNIQNSEQE